MEFLKKLSISPLAIIILMLFCAVDGTVFTFIMIGCATLHEVAHILTAIFLKVKIQQIKVLPFGVMLTFAQKNAVSYQKELVLALAGPLCNALIFILMLFYQALFGTNPLASFTALCSAILFFLNMLPIMPLDGGRALGAFLLMKFDVVRATIISDVVSIAVLICILGLGLYLLIITGYNFSLLIIATYLLIVFIAKNVVSFSKEKNKPFLGKLKNQ